MQWAVRQSSEAENYLTSVERIFEYAALKPEPNKTSDAYLKSGKDDKARVFRSWSKFMIDKLWNQLVHLFRVEIFNPNKDEDPTNFNRQEVKAQMRQIVAISSNQHTDYMNKEIAATNYSYRHSDQTAVVLKNLNFKISLGEKIGIVGRTGAGKSSLISSLFRLGLTDTGSVQFDGCDIGEIDLRIGDVINMTQNLSWKVNLKLRHHYKSRLRASISIIPQEPVIFSESVRRNLDPTDQYSDHELWEALRKVQLEKFVAEKTEKLDYQLAEQGANLSVGQKQLICLGYKLSNCWSLIKV